MRSHAFIVLFVASFQSACGKGSPRNDATFLVDTSSPDSGGDAGSSRLTYAGTDQRSVPHYFMGNLSPDDQKVLRQAFGVEVPSHLYLSDSTRDGLLKYDPQMKQRRTGYVNSYRIGFVSVRREGESWEQLQRRIHTLSRQSFPASSLISSNSISTMDPDIRGEVQQMLAAARRAGFDLHVVTTYRSPEQEAVLMAKGGERTHTLTSLHSYGRAIDLAVGNGNLGSASTRRSWIAFRRWVTRFRGNDFRILGAPDRSWDWRHVELPSDKIGFRTIDAAIARGRECLSHPSPHPCLFQPHLP
ncbi:MAG: hypothetical protein ABI408_13735 [Gemmatimonadaceae bacterium]